MAMAVSVVGPHPEAGVRFELERAQGGEPPWHYAGRAVTPEEVFSVAAVVSASGEVQVQLDEGLPPPFARALAEKIRLMLRTAHKQAHEACPGAPPPRRIVRWRGEK
jgi:hypothetical protein